MARYWVIGALVISVLGCAESSGYEEGTIVEREGEPGESDEARPGQSVDAEMVEEDVEAECPLNSGFSCSCDADECDDGSDCLYLAGMTSELGVCSTTASDGSCDFPDGDDYGAVHLDSEHCVVPCDDTDDCHDDQSCQWIPGTPHEICYPAE